MSQTKISSKLNHVMRSEHIFDKTIVFPEMKTAPLGCNNTSSILSAMLQDSEAVEDHLIDLFASKRVRKKT
jgi:hypothetical protein